MKRNWALIALVYLALAEVLSWAPVPDLALCLIQPEHSQQSTDHGDKKYCPAFHTGAALVFENVDSFLEHHDKSVIGGFTIVLAISTIGLWLATNKLWTAGEKQFGLLADTAAAQSRDMQVSIAAARDSADAALAALGSERAWMTSDGMQTAYMTSCYVGEEFVERGMAILMYWRNKGRSFMSYAAPAETEGTRKLIVFKNPSTHAQGRPCSEADPTKADYP